MRRPRIGIPLCLDERGRWREGRDYLYSDDRYASAVDRAGGQPLHLPIQSEPAALVDALDALLLPGGDDFPSERALPEGVELDLVPNRQIEFDVALLEAARAARLPVLGICYGMQLLASTSGGSLEPHLPSSGSDAGEHRLPESDRHLIEVATDTKLAAILGPGAHTVNSLHHQAVRIPGPGWRASAYGVDDVIEAIEPTKPGGRWEIGVQWHPEKMHEPSSTVLFGAFVSAARERAERGG